MTNTTKPANTSTGPTCGKCSTGFGKDRVQVRHATVDAIRQCFSTPAPIEIVAAPSPAQIQTLFAVPEATPLNRHFASCPKKGCTTTKVKDYKFTLRCYNHGRVVRVASKQLFGKASSKGHLCDSRCTGAKGPICECSCMGANHGADHLVTL